MPDKKEFKNPVTREEAEFMVDWYNGISGISWGLQDASKFKKAFERADKIRRGLWNKTFGDKSIYAVQLRGKNRKAYLVIDKFKESKLMGENTK